MMLPSLPKRLFQFSYLLSALSLLAQCRPPPEPSALSAPTSVQLLPKQAVLTTSPPLGSTGRGRTGSTDPTSFHALQLNLCNSGVAKCYAGGASIPEGATLIYSTAPNVVTINEICSDDVADLRASLAEAWPTDYTYSVFMGAGDSSKPQDRYRCTNGNPYGSAVLGRVPASKWTTSGGVQAYGGQYTTQDGERELRIFACASAAGDHFVCTTHLSAKQESVALAQCKALMFDALPYLHSQSTAQSGRTVVGGDFNLKYNKGGATNVQQCVPNGYTRKGDGDVQHVTFSNDLKYVSVKKYGLSYTDHDGFLVRLTAT